MHDCIEKSPITINVIWGLLCGILVLIGAMFTAWGAMEFKVLRAQIPQWSKLAVVGGLSISSFSVFFLHGPYLDFNGFTNSMNYEWHVVSLSDACYVIQFKRDTLRYILSIGKSYYRLSYGGH